MRDAHYTQDDFPMQQGMFARKDPQRFVAERRNMRTKNVKPSNYPPYDGAMLART